MYWFENIKDLFNLNKLDIIIPSSDMSYSEKVNTLVRLSIYIGLIMALIDYRFLFLPIFIMLLTYIVYLFRNTELKKRIERMGPNKGYNDLSEIDKKEFSFG